MIVMPRSLLTNPDLHGFLRPHGIMNSQESILVAGSNGFMLTADPKSFDLYRSQTDMIWSLGRMEDGALSVPYGNLGHQLSQCLAS
eukprot:SAG22_NODE_3559_length_1641_cov_1.954604_3_plen_86_part_00